jgi:hypothetical protein
MKRSILERQLAFIMASLTFLNPLAQAADEATQVLRSNCLECHNPKGKANKIFGDVLNTQRLIDEGVIVPGKADKSPLIQSVESGEMPPNKPLSPEHIKQLKDWIGAMPVKAEAIAEECRTLPDQLVDVRKDLESLPADARPHMRYISLANSSPHLSRKETYDALNKTVNSLSKGEKIVHPKAIGNGDLVRIDLRDYGWDRYDWENLQDLNPNERVQEQNFRYGYLDEKDLLRSLGTEMPIANADFFVATALGTDKYYELLDIYVSSLSSSGSDPNRSEIRAGFKISGVSSQNRVVKRVGSAEKDRPNYVWKSSDFASNTREQNIFRSPIRFFEDGGEIIFKLPNGLHGYALHDSRGGSLVKAPVTIVSDPNRPDRAITNPISCMNCHSKGLLPLKDDMHRFLNSDAAKLIVNAEEYESAKKLYVTDTSLKKAVDSDNASYQKAMEKLGGEPNMDSVVALFNAYEKDVDLKGALCTYGLSEKHLRQLLDNNYSSSDLGDLRLLRAAGVHISRQALSEAAENLGKQHEELRELEKEYPNSYHQLQKLLEEDREKVKERRKGSQAYKDYEARLNAHKLTCSEIYNDKAAHAFAPEERVTRSLDLLEKVQREESANYLAFAEQGLIETTQLLPVEVSEALRSCYSILENVVYDRLLSEPLKKRYEAYNASLMDSAVARMQRHPYPSQIRAEDGIKHLILERDGNPANLEYRKRLLDAGLSALKGRTDEQISWLHSKGHRGGYYDNEATAALARYAFEKGLEVAQSPLDLHRHIRRWNSNSYEGLTIPQLDAALWAKTYTIFAEKLAAVKDPFPAQEIPHLLQTLQSISEYVPKAQASPLYSKAFLNLTHLYFRNEVDEARLAQNIRKIYPPNSPVNLPAAHLPLRNEVLTLIVRRASTFSDDEKIGILQNNLQSAFRLDRERLYDNRCEATSEARFAKALRTMADSQVKIGHRGLGIAKDAPGVLKFVTTNRDFTDQLNRWSSENLSELASLKELYSVARSRMQKRGARSEDYRKLAAHLQAKEVDAQMGESSTLQKAALRGSFASAQSQAELTQLLFDLELDPDLKRHLESSGHYMDTYEALKNNFFIPFETRYRELGPEEGDYANLLSLYNSVLESDALKSGLTRKSTLYDYSNEATPSTDPIVVESIQQNFSVLRDLHNRGLRASAAELRGIRSASELLKQLNPDGRDTVGVFSEKLIRKASLYIHPSQIKLLDADFAKMVKGFRHQLMLLGASDYQMSSFEDYLKTLSTLDPKRYE